MTHCDRDATSPAKPLMLSSAVSLPPVGELTTMRSDIDGAVAASGAPPVGGPPGVSGLSTPPSPHQAETPTLNQRPTSPFALHSGTEHAGGPFLESLSTLPVAAQAKYTDLAVLYSDVSDYCSHLLSYKLALPQFPTWQQAA